MTSTLTPGMPEELPEPRYWWEPTPESGLSESHATWSDIRGPHRAWKVTHYFTADQLRTYGLACFNAGRAEAGKDADKVDAARWRRLVNASEASFPIATVVDDPENDKFMLYGRERLESYIDRLDEISDSYPDAPTPPAAMTREKP